MANKPGRPHRFEPSEVAEALRKARGVKAAAARALGCHQSTVTSYCRNHPCVQAAFEEATAVSLDDAEGFLTQFVRGEVEGQSTREQLDAIKFFLRTKGRERGYGDAPAVVMKETAPTQQEASNILLQINENIRRHQEQSC